MEGTDTSRAEMAARRLPRSEASPTSPRTTTRASLPGRERSGKKSSRTARPRCCGGVGRRWRTHLRYRDMDQGVVASTLVIGASAANDRAMAASIDAGEIITPHFEPTFSDGTAGGLEDDTITFDICRALVDRWVDISELEIARAVASMIDDHHHLVEGLRGGACGSHTVRRYEPRYSGCRRQLWCQRRCNVARGDVGDGQPLGQRQPDPGCGHAEHEGRGPVAPRPTGRSGGSRRVRPRTSKGRERPDARHATDELRVGAAVESSQRERAADVHGKRRDRPDGTDIDACQRSSVPAAAVTTNSTAITPAPPPTRTRSGRARG